MERELLARLHGVQLALLDEAVRLCEAHGLTYYLVAGTLLGAVRHGGFISWDDDLDIAMPRADFERFIDVCETELDPDYWLQSYRNDDGWWLLEAKLKKKNTCFLEAANARLPNRRAADNGIFIDVFPLDDARREDGLQIRQQRLLSKLQGMGEIKRSEKQGAAWKRLLVKAFSLRAILHMQQRIMRLQNGPRAGFYVGFASQYGCRRQTIPKDRYDPPGRIEFEGKHYAAPQDTDYFLRRLYGDDYMTPPPPARRVTHSPVRLSFDTEGQDEII